LRRVLPDPMGFVERVVGELAGRLSTPQPTGGPAVIATVDAESLAVDEALADHWLLLAGALGACACWGRDPGCPSCAGKGGPGWEGPDPALYAEFVVPAVRRMRAGPAEPDTHLDGPPPSGAAPDHPTLGGQE
ncbi:MAG TPA: hypothetical protein VGJ44_10395, partial [Kribbellaceae bacterium]